MPEVLEGELTVDQARFGIVVSRFNEFVTKPMLEGALNTFQRHGADLDQITIAWCPGAFEAPLVAKKMAASGKYDAIICLGAVIKGATAHFDYVAGQAASGVATVMLQSELPVLFGIITTDTIEQAIERAGSKAGNKGSEAAVSAIEMVNLLRKC